MKTILTTILLLVPIICFGHNISQEGLWKGYLVQDSLGEEINYKRQDFVKVKEDFILLFQFKELMSMETGEVTIKTVIDTLIVEPSESNLEYILLYEGEYLKLKTKSKNEFQIIFPNFVLTFKRIKDLEESKILLKEYEKFILGNTFVEVNPLTNKALDNLSKTYQKNGKVKYKKLDSKSNWESEFRIVEFEGFVFVKGITSAPIILKNIRDYILNGLEVDYRFNPKDVYFGKLGHLAREENSKAKPTKPFNIEPSKKTINECISALSNAQLDLEVNIAKGITEKIIPTVQVQHSYECGWMLFHEKDFDGFAKSTIKELLKIDSSLCYILEIPCGYYAERDSKKDSWYIYLHEDRIETDSSYIFKKAFSWDNTYRVINELKDKDLVHYEDYYLDTRTLKKTWTYLKGKEVGVTRFYNEDGKLKQEIKN